MAGIACGSQIILCDLPVRLDTYQGCSHFCRYCFVRKQYDISNIKPVKCAGALRNFITGKRPETVNWCDWDIPLHWGGVSDPFQPAERLHRASLQCLDVFADTGYPFVFSTKGRLVVEPEYLARIRASRCVAQVSMVCSRYDQMETGAPSYDERLGMCEKLAQSALRVIARAQPYLPEVRGDVLKNLPRLRDAGVYGVVFEGMKFKGEKEGMVKLGDDYCYPREVLERDFKIFRQACHENGLRFFAGENRLRTMGDSMCCCGIEGLEGFKGNDFNIVHLKAGEKVTPTERMKLQGTGRCFGAIGIRTTTTRRVKMNSFFQEMMRRLKLGNVGI